MGSLCEIVSQNNINVYFYYHRAIFAGEMKTYPKPKIQLK